MNLVELQEIVDRKARVLRCEVSHETNSRDSYPYSQEADNNTNRINLLTEETQQVLLVEVVSVMTINTSHVLNLRVL